MSLYKMPVSELKGFGEKRAEQFEKLGVRSVGELLNFYPRAYEDWTSVEKIENLTEGGTYCICAKLGTPVSDALVKGGMVLSRATVYDDTGSLKLIWFNNRYISRMLAYGGEYFFFGKITVDNYGVQMVAPTFSPVGKGAGIHPVYRSTAGLSGKTISAAVEQSLKLLPAQVNDPIPETMRKKYGLCDLRQALCDIHFPKTREALETARKRLVTEELLVLNLGMRSLRGQSRGVTGVRITEDHSAAFERLLPFAMTGAQKRAVADCLSDMMRSGAPMNRLVQGDVGAGKTAVAASVCYTTVKNGFQAAFMAPTEILARQHYENLSQLLQNTGVRVALLVGSLKPSEQKRVRAALADGEIDLIIGTHSLIGEKTAFKNLGLAVTDEQHRFGVAQRAALLGKGENPHLMVMSATPIPRTLGLIIFGDLDISVIDELPPSRKPVRTVWRTTADRQKIYRFIKSEIAAGRQAFIVCPMIEEGESMPGVASAEEYAAELMRGDFADIPVAVVHGKTKPDEKEAVMADFAANKYALLVATTVIEVGVDVPNASVMVIENAERFGLSQLHQLRGRVGRGSFQSYCILISDVRSPVTTERLRVMCATNDGFKIADEDLKMRGPGDFFGERQHGLPQMAIADFADTKSLELSQRIADDLLFTYKDLRSDDLRLLKAEVDRLFSRGGQNILN